MHGGMPLAVTENSENEKRKYLTGLYKNVYLKDIVERYKLKDDEVLEALIDSLSSSIGSLTNPHNLANAAGTLMKRSTSDNTIKKYLVFLEDAFLFLGAKRYDIKGKRYFENTQKYYSMDLGLRNAKLNFRQLDRGHLMERQRGDSKYVSYEYPAGLGSIPYDIVSRYERLGIGRDLHAGYGEDLNI